MADFSTGSVGLGAVAPLFSALTRRYTDSHFGAQPSARFIALVGDAELDEGNVWEAIADPATQELGNFTMVVDLNRQSLDRVIPDIAAIRLKRFFADAGWHVAEAKYGARLTAAFAEPGGDALAAHIDSLSNEAYQELFALSPPDVRRKFLVGADAAVVRIADGHDDDALATLVTDLGGHDLGLLIDTFRECDEATDQPSVVFAYTIKGHGLPMAGDPMNHAALLSAEQLDAFRAAARPRRDHRVGPLRSRLAGRSTVSGRRQRHQQHAARSPTDPGGPGSGTPGRHQRRRVDPGGLRAGVGEPRRRGRCR